MKISYNWLKEYLNISLDHTKVAEILTDIGLEVEGIETYESIKGGLKGLVIGKVLTKEKHPDADKLSCTTVDIGDGKETPIVCGAPNVDAGQTVVVATIGTKLYDGDDEFKIKKSKIRGKVSEGMICAEDEIGLGQSHDGIMVLPEEIKPGTPASEYFKIENDIVFEIGLTPNRIDAASHIGVARDFAAYLSMSGKQELLKPSIDNFTEGSKNPVTISVENNESCPRYTGLVIEGVKVEDSPEWLKNRLKSIGLSPINNIVDITNYVLHEIGQPLHAFDLAEVTGNKIIVKNLPEKTKFTTLDEEERELSENDLMICNEAEGMCIAGVFGGIKSGVKESTTDIFLESAYFNPVSIRKTAKFHALNTDASFRFERGIDPNGQIWALKRAATLICEIAGGTVSSPIFDSKPAEVNGFDLELPISKIHKLIGKEIELEKIKKILSALDIEIKEENEGVLKLTVAPYRVDVQRSEDVIEEILRIYGYNNVEIPQTVKSSLIYEDGINDNALKNTVADILVANGFYEAMNNSLTRKAYYENGDFDTETLVEILNPLSNDLNIMRQSLVFGGLESVAHNINRKSEDLKLFEFGRTYAKKGDKYKEEQQLALFVCGDKWPESWNSTEAKADYFMLKGITEEIISRLGFHLNKFEKEQFSKNILKGLSLKKDTKEMMQIGMVPKKKLKAFGIDVPVYCAIIKWDTLLNKFNNEVSFEELPKFPYAKRDLSLLVDSSVTFESLKQAGLKTEKKLLKEVGIFDVYNGEGIPEGKKSYALSFILEDKENTLTDKRIDKIMKKLINKYQQEFNAELR